MYAILLLVSTVTFLGFLGIPFEKEQNMKKAETDPRLAHSQALWAKLGMPLDILDDLVIPDIPEGWTGLAIIPPISNETLFALCEKHFPSWKYYENLDEIKGEQERPKRAYVLAHRGGIEPDAVDRNKSYDQCIKEDLIFLTQKERICVELLCFAETGEHLDVVGVTITSSLTMDGRAYCACWDSRGREFCVYGGDLGDAYPTFGPRQAVFA